MKPRKQKSAILVKLYDFSKNPRMMVFAVFVAVGILGAVLIATSRADSFSKGMEAEDGQIAGNAKKVADTAASGGNKVTFASGSTGGGGGGAEGVTAAQKFNWGTPVWADEFNYGSEANPVEVDQSKWEDAGGCFAGHNGNGRRCGKNSRVDGSKLVMTGDENGDTGWLKSKMARTYGRYEVRGRSYDAGNSGNEYHTLYMTWPNNDDWPGNGEYDWVENDEVGANYLQAYIHYPHPNLPVQQEHKKKEGVDMTQWHNFAFEWTSAGVKGYVDGEEWFSFSGGSNGSRKNIQDMKDGAITIQLDNFYGGGMKKAKFETDWIRVYNP